MAAAPEARPTITEIEAILGRRVQKPKKGGRK